MVLKSNLVPIGPFSWQSKKTPFSPNKTLTRCVDKDLVETDIINIICDSSVIGIGLLVG